MNKSPLDSSSENEPLRPHAYDGIQEYDNRLPNWWLLTLYGTIVFSIAYWFYYVHSSGPSPDREEIAGEMVRIEALRLSSSGAVLDDDHLWQMSRNPVIVLAGKATFMSTCASCHKESLRGVDEGGIGANLIDHAWLHGGRPTAIYNTVDKGVLAKGMLAWGPVLGPKKISEAVAFILSYHQPSEPEMAAAQTVGK